MPKILELTVWVRNTLADCWCNPCSEVVWPHLACRSWDVPPDSFIHTHTHTRATLAVLFAFYHTCVYTLSKSLSHLAISGPSLGTHLNSGTVRISAPHATVLENGLECSRSCFWPWHHEQLRTKAHVSEWWQAVTSPSSISIPPLLTCSGTHHCFFLLAIRTWRFVDKHVFLHACASFKFVTAFVLGKMSCFTVPFWHFAKSCPVRYCRYIC